MFGLVIGVLVLVCVVVLNVVVKSMIASEGKSSFVYKYVDTVVCAVHTCAESDWDNTDSHNVEKTSRELYSVGKATYRGVVIHCQYDTTKGLALFDATERSVDTIEEYREMVQEITIILETLRKEVA